MLCDLCVAKYDDKYNDIFSFLQTSEFISILKHG